jgi:hypothetical protein
LWTCGKVFREDTVVEKGRGMSAVRRGSPEKWSREVETEQAVEDRENAKVNLQLGQSFDTGAKAEAVMAR